MLGHAKLDTTQIYAQVSIRHLKQVHEMTHPSALRGPNEDRTTNENDENAEDFLAALADEGDSEIIAPESPAESSD